MIRRPPRSTLSSSSAASDVYKRQDVEGPEVDRITGLLGNENDVFNEISYRFENSVIPEELKLLGVKKGSTIKLGSFEFIYEN